MTRLTPSYQIIVLTDWMKYGLKTEGSTPLVPKICLTVYKLMREQHMNVFLPSAVCWNISAPLNKRSLPVMKYDLVVSVFSLKEVEASVCFFHRLCWNQYERETVIQTRPAVNTELFTPAMILRSSLLLLTSCSDVTSHLLPPCRWTFCIS